MLGCHVVLAYVVLDVSGPAVVLSCLVITATIRHGRDGATGQPEPSSATIDLNLRADPLAVEVGIGSILKVTTTTTTGATTRFWGRITDVYLGWEDAGPATPDRPLAQITAIGPLADLGRRVIGAAPFPQELDGARVTRVLTAAGVPFTAGNVDAGTVQVNPRDIDSSDALSVARDTATDAGGYLWQTRGGAIAYADADHRRNLTPTFTLDSCDLLVTPTWRRSLEGLINHVSIGYGVPAGGGEQS